MRIVLVNWAKIWDGATHGGGVNGYCQALALALVRHGHDVVSLSAGTTFTPGPAGPEVPGPCEVRRHPDWLGIRVFEVFNSPVLAPSFPQFRDPQAESSSPELEARVGEFLRLLAPDIVHFHNIEGLSAGCVAAARRSGAATIFSLHNYQPVCPQVYLMQHHRVPCFSFDSGHACDGCIEAPDPAEERRRRLLTILPSPPKEVPAPAEAREPVLGRLISELGSLVLPRPPAPGPSPGEAPPVPGMPADSEASIRSPMPAPSGDARGKTRFLQGELEPRRWPGPLDPEWQPLANTPTPDPPTGRTPNAYAGRRSAMVRMLNDCDRVLAVSNFVRAKYEALGVSPRNLRTLHIGSRAGEVAARHAELVFDPPPFSSVGPVRPIRLVFMGYNHWYKGLSMLADTLELLTPEYLRQIDLSVFALGGESIEWRFRRMEPRLAALKIGHGYEYHDIPWICGGRDLGLVPSVWWDNAPQTVFEFFACGLPILAADLGGIPDFVRHDHNGLLFRGNDRFDMAAQLVRVIRDPAILSRLRAGVRPPKGIDEHAAELERVYAECVSFPNRPVPSPAAMHG